MKSYKINSDPQRGRKSLSPEERKDRTITIRVTDNELASIKEKASSEGFKEMAHYIRVNLLNQKTKPLISICDKDLLRQINAIGNNLNQLAKDYNTSKKIDDFNINMTLKKLQRTILKME